jgi:low affinity Fe/Cu permease
MDIPDIDRLWSRKHMIAEAFGRLARSSSQVVGSSWAFAIALLLVLVWGVTGPAFHFSDAWQLTINTGTTIITFLTVFLIQHSQNRDTQVTQLKLDELIRAMGRARNELVDMEDLSDEELRRLQHQFEKLRLATERRLLREADPSRPRG